MKQAANYLNSLVVFKKLLMEADFLTVLVLSTPKVGNMPLVCMDGTKEKQYGGDTYEIIECEGRNIVHVNSTDGYYLEGEYEVEYQSPFASIALVRSFYIHRFPGHDVAIQNVDKCLGVNGDE